MEYEIKLNEREIQLVLQSMGELPLKVSLNVFLKINEQVSQQNKSEAEVRAAPGRLPG